jgi:hypothetical protein
MIAPYTVAVGSGDVAPTTGTPGQATMGNPTLGTPPTQIAAYVTNMLLEELRAVIVASGQTPSSTNWAQLLQAFRTYASTPLVAVAFTTAGSFSWTCPANVMSLEELVLIGPGGGGSNCDTTGTTPEGAMFGGGGGGGGIGVSRGVAVTPGTTYAITVGAGGASNISALPAATSSAFGVVANGGQGSQFVTGGVNSPGGYGGTVSGANLLNATGADGGDGQSGQTVTQAGMGAPGYLGAGAGRAGEGGGQPGTAPGAGGGGAYDSANSATLFHGGTGAPGAVLFVYRQPL